MLIDDGKRPRSALKSYFANNAIPTADQFAQLIDGGLNLRDDGLVKTAGDPLAIEAGGDSAATRRAVDFYMNFADADPAWSIALKPRADPADPATGRLAWSVLDGAGTARLAIDGATGNVGIGTVQPAEKLDVAGRVRAGGAAIGPWPANGNYAFFGASTLDQTQAANYALLQSTAGSDIGTTYLNSPSSIVMRLDNVTTKLIISDTGIDTYAPLRANGNLWVAPATDLTTTGSLNLIKFGSTGDYQILHKQVGQWGKPTLGYHCQNTHAIGFYTTGWTPLLECDGATGNVFYRGTISKLDVGPTFTAVVRCADFTIGGQPGRRAVPGRALVDGTDTLVVNCGPDWPKTYIDGQTTIPRLVQASSAALKEDVRPVSGAAAAAIVASLDPVSFRWKDDAAGEQLGFIAEDCPDAVTTAERDGVFMSHIVAALTRVVRDQGDTIAALQARLDAIDCGHPA